MKKSRLDPWAFDLKKPLVSTKVPTEKAAIERVLYPVTFSSCRRKAFIERLAKDVPRAFVTGRTEKDVKAGVESLRKEIENELKDLGIGIDSVLVTFLLHDVLRDRLWNRLRKSKKA